MLATLGDLLEDIVVRLDQPINRASDTGATIVRRQGGSAANVARVAASLGAPVRFLGQVGNDAVGAALVDELASAGVDTQYVPADGSTGTIVVLVDQAGERTMLTDRRACVALTEPRRSWLAGVTTLHVPFYSLAEEPIATTARTLIGWAHELDIPVSIDASSSALLQADERWAIDQLRAVAPTLLLANDDEAAVLGDQLPTIAPLAIVKRGGRPAVIYRSGQSSVEVAAEELGAGLDTTGAGDAFAAGFLVARNNGHVLWENDPVAACAYAHWAAAKQLRSR
ncbi:MAG: carbohydrate kinase family protein [Acidimicrobiales bacterium]